MSKLSKKMQELKRVIRLHANWLVYATLGESALSKSEIEELEKYGKLPMDKTLDLADKSYLLGRLRAILKRSEYKDISYEEAEEKLTGMKLSPIEELVLEQARLKAGQALKGLAQEISDGVYSALAQSLGTAVTEASIHQIVADETELALIYKKTAQELASSLAARLQTSAKRDWKMVAQTELQRAKVAGQAQAIVNKIDIYEHSDGPDSKVSVIPAANCCEDCKEHYLDASGNPKIFTLSELMSAGSNADPGVIHKKKQGVHTHWKTTLPPLHPNCGCNLVFVPSGYGWSAGKLGLLNKSLFDMSLRKANSTAGVSGGISPTVTPKGPPQPKPATASTGTPSVAGAAAPGNVPGPGKPPGSGGGTSPSGSTQQMSPCPFGGGSECVSHGGNGATEHKASGAVMKKHQEAMARGAQPTTELAKEQQKQQFESQAKEFNKQENPHQKVLDHLSTGQIGSKKQLENDESGINQSYKVAIIGNGSGLMKGAVDFESIKDHYNKVNPHAEQATMDNLMTPGRGTMPEGLNPHAEEGAYKLAVGLGLTDLVPPTTTRHEEGKHTSVQAWHDGAVGIRQHMTNAGLDLSTASYKDLVNKTAPGHSERVHEQLSTIAVMHAIMNNNDGHIGNVLFKNGGKDIHAIDHGVCFGTGMLGHKNGFAHEMHGDKVALQIPPALKAKLDNSTLESTMRTLDKVGIPEWAKAQTFLRTRYMSHIQDHAGHIPFDRLRGTQANIMGEVEARHAEWDNDFMKYFKAEKNQELPHQKFDSWAKDYMTTAAADPAHPDHEDAKRLLEMKPLRSALLSTKNSVDDVDLDKHFDSIGPYSTDDLKSVEQAGLTTKPHEQETTIRTPPTRSSDSDRTAPRGKVRKSLEEDPISRSLLELAGIPLYVRA